MKTKVNKSGKPIKSAISAACKTFTRGKAVLPILHKVAVSEGMAEMTDMNMTARWPLDMANGIYTVIGDTFVHDKEFELEDFPLVASVSMIPMFAKVTISAEVLNEALINVRDAISTDENRYILKSVLFERKNGSSDIRLVATDGRRMHIETVKASINSKAKDFCCVVSSDTIDLIAKMYVGGDVTIEFFKSKEKTVKRAKDAAVEPTVGERAIFHFGRNMEVRANLVDGKYPNYERAIPGEVPIVGTIDAQAWLDKIATLVPFMKHVKKAEGCCISVKLTVMSSGAASIGFTSTVSGCEKMSVDLPGFTVKKWEAVDNVKNSEPPATTPATERHIAFNPDMFTEMLAGGPTEFRMNDELDPIVLASSTFTGVLMPIRCS
jgi:DNA polymerase III sliding clamp (beta) subunit (PCNA family)